MAPPHHPFPPNEFLSAVHILVVGEANAGEHRDILEITRIPFVKELNFRYINSEIISNDCGGSCMYSTYRIKANEINQNFLKGIKEMFKDREIEIVVHDVEDETEYLLKTDNNKKHLLKAIKNVEKKKDLVAVEVTEL